jgi:hypothetical protein
MNSAPEAGQPSAADPAHLTPADLGNGWLLAEGFSVDGPFAQVQGREPVRDSAAGLKPIAPGHRLLRQRADGEHVCSWLDVSPQTPVKAQRLRLDRDRGRGRRA